MAHPDVVQRKMLRSELPFAWAKMVNPRHARVNINDIPFKIPNDKKLGLWASSDFSCVSKSESAIFFLKIRIWFDTLWFNDFFSFFVEANYVPIMSSELKIRIWFNTLWFNKFFLISGLKSKSIGLSPLVFTKKTELDARANCSSHRSLPFPLISVGTRERFTIFSWNRGGLFRWCNLRTKES